MPSSSGLQGGSGDAVVARLPSSAGPVGRLLDALLQVQPAHDAETALGVFMAGVRRALPLDDAIDGHWRLHELALSCDRAGEAMLARGRLESGVSVLRLGLEVRERLAALPVTDALFRETVDVPIEVAASHFSIANAFRRGGRPAEALDEMLAGIESYRREVESGGDAYGLDTLAAHMEDAGRIARDIPARDAMRAYFAESLALRERAALLGSADPDLARAFVESCVWRAPDLGKASAPWLDRARRLLADRERDGRPVPGTARLRNLVDTAGAPYLSG
jgi:hypothetical protein